MHHTKKVTLIGKLFWYGVWTIPTVRVLATVIATEMTS